MRPRQRRHARCGRFPRRCALACGTIGRRRASWLYVHQWAESIDNHPDADYPTLRVALDKAAPHNPVFLMGDSGHRSGFNSAALALARDRSGKVVGISKRDTGGPARRLPAAGRRRRAGRARRARQRRGALSHGCLAPELREPRDRAGASRSHRAAAEPGGHHRLPRRRRLRGRLARVRSPARLASPDGARRPWRSATTRAAIATPPAASTTTASSPGRRRCARATPTTRWCAPISSRCSPTGSWKPIPLPSRRRWAMRPCWIPTCSRSSPSIPAATRRVTGYVDTDSGLCQEVRAQPGQYAGRGRRRGVHRGARLPSRPVPGVERQARGRPRRADGADAGACTWRASTCTST